MICRKLDIVVFLGKVSLLMRVISLIILFNHLGQLIKQLHNNYKYIAVKTLSGSMSRPLRFCSKNCCTKILFQVLLLFNYRSAIENNTLQLPQAALEKCLHLIPSTYSQYSAFIFLHSLLNCSKFCLPYPIVCNLTKRQLHLFQQTVDAKETSSSKQSPSSQ